MSKRTQAASGEKILRTACHLCHGGCILLAHVKDGKLVKTEGDPDGPHNRGTICEKGLSATQVIYSPDRIKYPMKRVGERGGGKWQRISWDEALDTIAEKLQKIKDEYGPWSIAYAWGTGRVPRCIPFIGFFSGALGTPNGIGIGHICLTKTRMPVMSMTVGPIRGPAGWGINRDFEKSACIVAWGETLIEGRCDYMGTSKRVTDALKRGAKLIVIDPVFTRAAQKAHSWVQIRPGTDVTLGLSWMNVIINEGLYDKDFVENWTNAPFLWRSDTRRLLRPSDVIAGGNSKHFMVWDTASKDAQIWNSDTVSYERSNVKAALTGTYRVTLADGKVVECKTVWQLLTDNVKEWTPEKASEITWVPAERIRESARMYATNRPACIEWGVAPSQCARSTANNHTIMILEAITGNIDVRGGNPFWIIPKFREIGDAAKAFNQGLTPEQEAHRITGGFPFSANPDLTPLPSAWQPGVWRTIVTEDPYPIKALFVTDSNPLVGHEKSDRYILQALRDKLEFIAWSDLVMTPSNQYADIILPVSTPYERNWVLSTNEVGVMAGQAVIEPLYESKSDFDIYRELCVRWGREDVWPWKTEEEWCDWQLEELGITFKELVKTCLYPAPEIWKKYEKGLLRKDGKNGFATSSGKCELYASIVENFGLNPLPLFAMPLQSYETTPELAKDYPLILMTGSRELDYPFFHSQFRHVPRLREMQPFPVILINPETANKLGIKDGDWAWVETNQGKARFKSQITERIHPKVVSVTHGWWYPELPAPTYGVFESNVNILMDPFAGCDPATGTTELRSLLCKVYRADGPPPGVKDNEQGGS